jgi:hypothetical protein
MPIRYLFRRLAIVVAAVQFLAPATSGAQRALTAADYDRAVRMLPPAATTVKVTLLEPAPVVAVDFATFSFQVPILELLDWARVVPASTTTNPIATTAKRHICRILNCIVSSLPKTIWLGL